MIFSIFSLSHTVDDVRSARADRSLPDAYPKDHVEEIRLKKKKLQLKDQMNSMIQKFRSELSHQHS